MKRALFALSAWSLLAAGAAHAQQICCVAQQPGPNGLRGYAQPQYPAPAYPAAQYAPPQYAPPQYPPPQYGQPQYAEPRYPDRPAPSGLRGYVGVEYGKARIQPGSPDTRVETWTGEGAVAGQIGGFGVQGDIKVANFNTEGSSADDATSVSPSVHVFQRNQSGLIGGWAGWSNADGANLFGIGAEAQAYMAGATLYGSVGYGRVNDTVDQNLWAARLEGRYFVTENLMLNATGGLVRATGNGAKSTVRSIGFGAEYQPGNLPFSVRASYAHADASNSTAASDTIRVGMRWNFDGGTLAERDRLGASLANVTDQFSSN